MGMDAHIPKRTINKRKKDKPWMTGYIRYLLMLCNKMNGVFGRSGRLEDRAERNRLRALSKKEIRIAKAKYRANHTAQLADPDIGVKRYWASSHYKTPPLRNLCLKLCHVYVPEWRPRQPLFFCLEVRLPVISTPERKQVMT